MSQERLQEGVNPLSSVSSVTAEQFRQTVYDITFPNGPPPLQESPAPEVRVPGKEKETPDPSMPRPIDP